MSMRIRRLYAEQRGLEEAFAADPIIEVRPVAGDPEVSSMYLSPSMPRLVI